VDWAAQCAVVIPCRNEAASIGPLVRAVRKFLPHVIVVNDGSVDHTAQAAASAKADVVSHNKPQGKGAALKLGWKTARQRGFQWVMCMDGDGQHVPADIPRFLGCAERLSATLVVGNRMNAAQQMPFTRRWVNRWMSRVLSRLAGHPLPDSQCGFRLVQLKTLEKMKLTSAHFEIESEQLLAFIRAGERVEFVPVRVIYRTERSKIHPLRDTWRWFRWLCQQGD
jgi:glycosyltransferase involved in cell wall biosynthesis